MSYVARFIVRIFLSGIVLLALVAFNLVIESLHVYDYLVVFFRIMRQVLEYIDFIIDTSTLMTLVATSLLIQVAYWSLKGVLWCIRFFKSV